LDWSVDHTWQGSTAAIGQLPRGGARATESDTTDSEHVTVAALHLCVWREIGCQLKDEGKYFGVGGGGGYSGKVSSKPFA